MDAFISFSYLITLVRSSSSMFDRNSGSRQSCLVSDSKGKDLNFSPLSIMFAWNLSYMGFIMLRSIPSLPSLLINIILLLLFLRNFWTDYFKGVWCPNCGIFYHEKCFVKCFLYITWRDHVIFISHSVNVLYHMH